MGLVREGKERRKRRRRWVRNLRGGDKGVEGRWSNRRYWASNFGRTQTELVGLLYMGPMDSMRITR
jgi:hypothetical protein